MLLTIAKTKSAEIIPVWHTESGAGDIQDIEFLKGHEEFLMLVGVGSEAQLQIRSTETGELINSVPTSTSIESRIAITPDSTRFIHLDGGGAHIRKIDNSFAKEGLLFVNSDSIVYRFTDIAIDPIRPLVYVTIFGQKGAHPNITTKSKVSVYNYETREFIKDLTELGNYKYSVIEVSDDGKYLATLNDGKAYLKVWDLETMELIVDEKLFADIQDFWSDSRDIKFSALNNSNIYISGTFTDKLGSKDLGSGCYLFNIGSKTRELLLPNATYGSDKIILFDNESRIFNSIYIRIGILNLILQELEWYGKPPQFTFSNKVIYSQDLKSFIGFTGNNISNFQYDSQTNIIDEIIKEIVISPNPTYSYVNIDITCTEPYIDFQINNSQGLKLIHNSIENPKGNIQLDFSLYPSGVYLLTLICNKVTKTYKIIKEG
jgi:hypothetical protein